MNRNQRKSKQKKHKAQPQRHVKKELSFSEFKEKYSKAYDKKRSQGYVMGSEKLNSDVLRDHYNAQKNANKRITVDVVDKVVNIQVRTMSEKQAEGIAAKTGASVTSVMQGRGYTQEMYNKIQAEYAALSADVSIGSVGAAKLISQFYFGSE